jgi:signal transduction histidine kinase
MSRRSWAAALTALSVMSLIVVAVVDFGQLTPWGGPTVVAVAVAGLLTWRVPGNLVGWLLLAFSSSTAVAFLLLTLATVMGDPEPAAWLDAVGNSLATAGVLALPAVFLRFPDGSLPGRRWKVVEWITAAAALAGAGTALLNGGWGGDVGQALVESPLRAVTSPWGDVSGNVFFPLLLASMLLASASLVVRYRAVAGEDRLRIKWLALSGMFVFAAFVIVLASGDWRVALVETWETVLIAMAFASIPIAIGIAILQYRLYDIDLVISRAVVLAVLAGFITVVYALFVVGIGRLIGGETDGLALPILATAVVAIAFEPVRHRAQRWANRLVFGRRATPYEVLADLTERLSGSEVGQGILARMAERLGAGTGAERATIWLVSEDGLAPAASWPDGSVPPIPDLGSEEIFHVTHDDELVGAFEVVKPKGSALSTAERLLITDLAGSAGAVLGYQRLNDSLRSTAEALSESRARLVGAADAERRRLERDLHDGAQQHIVALKVKMGLARSIAERNEADQIATLLAGLSEEAQAALEEIRSLAKGIYPPVLESDGLVAAVSALAAGSPADVSVDRGELGRYERDIEAAVYFDISEAVTNAVKHGANSVRVRLVDHGDRLAFEVTDSGPGFEVARANGGSGLQNMRDRMDAVGGRLDVVSRPGEGTIVRGEIPLEMAPL